MKKIYTYSIMIIFLMMLFGCTGSQLKSQFYERVVPSELGDVANLDKYGIRYFDEGAIIIFTGKDPQRFGYGMMGYAVFRKDIGGWRTGQGGGSSRQKGELTDTFIDYLSTEFNFQGKGRDIVFDYRLLAGEILSPKVHMIEVVLDDGTILQDDGEGGIFAFKTGTDRAFCELNVLDDQGGILESIVPEYRGGPSPTPEPDC